LEFRPLQHLGGIFFLKTFHRFSSTAPAVCNPRGAGESHGEQKADNWDPSNDKDHQLKVDQGLGGGFLVDSRVGEGFAGFSAMKTFRNLVSLEGFKNKQNGPG